MKSLILGLKLFGGVVLLAFCAQVAGDMMRVEEEEGTPGIKEIQVDMRVLDRLDNEQVYGVRKASVDRIQLLTRLIQSFDERIRQLQQRILDPSYVNTPEQLEYQQTLLDHAMGTIAHFEKKLEQYLRTEATEFRKQGLDEPIVLAVLEFEKPFLEDIAKQWRKLFRLQRDYLTNAAEAITFLKGNIGNYEVIGGKVRFSDPTLAREYHSSLAKMSTFTNLMGESATALDRKRRAFQKAMEEKFVLG